MTEELAVAIPEVEISDADAEKALQLVVTGDLVSLSPKQRLWYIVKLCRQYNIDPSTKPFDFLQLQGKLVLYANRNCADQLRRNHNIRIEIVERQLLKEEGVYLVRARAELPDGRTDESLGAVGIIGQSGTDLANSFLKAETKAKRRVTQSIVGLSLPDETEVQDIPRTPGELPVAPRRFEPRVEPRELGGVQIVGAAVPAVASAPTLSVSGAQTQQPQVSQAVSGAGTGTGPSLPTPRPPAVPPITVPKATK